MLMVKADASEAWWVARYLTAAQRPLRGGWLWLNCFTGARGVPGVEPVSPHIMISTETAARPQPRHILVARKQISKCYNNHLSNTVRLSWHLRGR